MESLPPSSKTARVAHPGVAFGPTSCWNMKRNGASMSSPPIGLGLEVSRGNNGGNSGTMQFNGSNKSLGFTLIQYQELQLQLRIYKYIAAGFVVPYNLVLPIWNSVITSLGGFTPTLYQLYPSFMGGSSPMQLEHNKKSDPQPERCKRTDGKKWRCTKAALYEKKYCQKHIHRGRHRSRKLVEANSAQPPCPAANTVLSIAPPTSSATTATSNVSLANSGVSPESVLLGDAEKK